MIGLLFEQAEAKGRRGSRSRGCPRGFRYSPMGSIGLRNLPCSTVNAQTENSIGARFCNSKSDFQHGGRILAAGKRHSHTVAVANHLETAHRFPHLAQQCLFQVHWINYTGWVALAARRGAGAEMPQVMDAREH